MKIEECVDELSRLVGGLSSEDQKNTYGKYLSLAGVKEGPALADAVLKFGLKNKKRWICSPAEFVEDYYEGDGRGVATASGTGLYQGRPMQTIWWLWNHGRDKTGLPFVPACIKGNNKLHPLAHEYAKHVKVLEMSDDHVKIRPLTTKVRKFWEDHEIRGPVEDAIKRDIVVEPWEERS